MRTLTSILLFAACAALAQQREQSPVNTHLFDVLRVRAQGQASDAVVTPKPGIVTPVQCDVVIIGAGMGGTSAALHATQSGLSVCMTEPTLWVGGQTTSQGVSAFDDNKWIDSTGGTRSYLDLSRRIRTHYAGLRKDKAISVDAAINGPIKNPGHCWVGRLCFEPEPAAQVIHSLLDPAIAQHKLRLYTHTIPVSAQRNGRTLQSVLVYNFATEKWLRLHGRFFVDASELGDLLPLTGLPFRIGAEGRDETHERDAAAKADPHASQSFTYPFVLEQQSKPSTAIEPKPPAYDQFHDRYTLTVDYGHGKFLTYGFFEARPGLPGSFWNYRQSVMASLYQPTAFVGDRSMINWSSNDHCDANLLSGDPLLQAQALQHAKQLSLGFAWWIRHEVPRDDHSGNGYPQLATLGAAMGTADGLSQHPYIREARRILPLRTIVEQDLGVDFQHGARAADYPDSVGIGSYPIDIHACEKNGYASASKPYQVPLGALIARDADNLMAASKDIGTTHITNGAYRLHPTEWAIGEAVGATLVYAMQHHTTPAAIETDSAQLHALQLALVRSGHPIFWYDDVPVDSSSFAAMQMAGVTHNLSLDPATLHGLPDQPATAEERSHTHSTDAPANITRANLAARFLTEPQH
jgi:hypothetical protein